jgi:hypothetical protein
MAGEPDPDTCRNPTKALSAGAQSMKKGYLRRVSAETKPFDR